MNPESHSEPDRTIAHKECESAEFQFQRSGPRYSLSNLHAAGGIGEIWLARDLDLDRDVAVKKLQMPRASSALAKARFLREARITGKLDHPGVVPIYEICEDEITGLPCYSMRFLRGRTLTEAVRDYHRQRSEGGTSIKTLVGLLNAFDIVCNTIAYAHSKGIIHRDLKCENVIIGDYGEVVVIDWGLAKQTSSDDFAMDAVNLEDAAPVETIAGQILGTPAYMAPEQAAGDNSSIGPAADIYGLCAILYEILCGQPPFAGTSTIEVLKQVRIGVPKRPSEIAPGVPPVLEQICLKGLAKAPMDRHPSAEQLAQIIRIWVSELAERRQSEEERERFFALSMDLLAIADTNGKLRQVSPAWTTLLDRDRDALLGHLFFEFIQPDDRTVVEQNLRDTANAAAFEARALHADGTTRWISWNITEITRERAFYIVGRDVTELKRSQQLFHGILQSAPDALIIINKHGRITLANRQVENIFGYRQEELLDQRIELLIPHRFREQHPEHVAGFFASSSFRPMGSGLALRGLRKNGTEFPAEISLSAITVESDVLVAASVRDRSDPVK